MTNVVPLTRPFDIGHQLVRRVDKTLVVRERFGSEWTEWEVPDIDAGKALIEERQAVCRKIIAGISADAAAAVARAPTIVVLDRTKGGES